VRRPLGTTLALVAALGLTGCAGRGRTVTSPAAKQGASQPPASGASLQEYIEKVRHLSTTVRPAGSANPALTLESRDPELAATLLELKLAPTAALHLAAAGRYRLRGVRDAAFTHYNAAAKLEPHNADAYEGLARVWRDWGMPHLALGDAARARFYAPVSASIQNTLGTIMQALGQTDEARRAYERAMFLDGQATYALNNLCYLSFVEGQMDRAVDQCRRAVAMDPALKSAHVNLALAYAGSGEMQLAQAALANGGDAAEANFNFGILHMARRDYRSAAAAFDAASRARPTLNLARERAQQARTLLRTQGAAPASTNEGDTK
jgi:Flp pilus assembly protein TadD